MQFTLSKSERLGRKDFRRAKWKKCGSTAHFLLFESRNDTSRKRFGVVIQRKIKGVVARNRIRRSIKEFLRLNKHLFKNCHDYSVRVVRMPERIRWDTVSGELQALASRTIKQ
jgi:ribonuclease P protein component